MNSTATRTEPTQAPAAARSHASMHLLMLFATFCWAANIVAGKEALVGFSCLLRLEPLTALKLTGMLVSFGGVAALTVGHNGQTSGAHWQGDLIVLASSAVFACYTILVKGVSDRYDALTLNTLVFGLGALLVVPAGAPAVLGVRWSSLPSPVWWSLAYMILFGSVVPYLIYAFALTELAASRVSASCSRLTWLAS